MNKSKVDELIPMAYETIKEIGIAENGKIPSSFRGQISSFGAAVSMGSLLSAIAFFSDKGSAEVDRTKLPAAILDILKKSHQAGQTETSLYRWVQKEKDSGRETACRESVLNAALAVKLAMNLYKLTEKSEANS